jgi:chitodextrinase
MLSLSELSYLTTYTVWVNATDPEGSGLYTRAYYTFTTKQENNPPILGTPTPTNGSPNQPLSLTWSIPINDLEGDSFSWTIECNNTQTSGGTGATNGTKTLQLSGLAYSTTYLLWVNATDTGSGQYTRQWYTFTTKANLPPAFGTPSPTNNSNPTTLTLSWSILINDPEGDSFSWTIQCSNGQNNSGNNATNGTKTLSLSGLAYQTTYKVWVNATDPAGSAQYTRRWYTFTPRVGSGPPPPPPPGPENKNPIADASAGAPYQGFVGSPILFDGSKSYDPDGNITKWLWDFGDNTTNTGETVNHTYSKAGTYTVRLTVTDNEGATHTDTTTCLIKQHNRPPSPPVITGPTSGTKNTLYTYTIVSTDLDNDTLQYRVDWGDTTVQSSGFLPNAANYIINHTWGLAGRYTVTVTVTDTQTEKFLKYRCVHRCGANTRGWVSA